MDFLTELGRQIFTLPREVKEISYLANVFSLRSNVIPEKSCGKLVAVSRNALVRCYCWNDHLFHITVAFTSSYDFHMTSLVRACLTLHISMDLNFGVTSINNGTQCVEVFTSNTNTNKNLYSAKFVDKTRQRRWVVS